MPEAIPWKFLDVGEVDSTQRVADGMANLGAPQGLVVLATEQVMGRGRLDREWLSPRGGLYMSLVLRPARKTEVRLLPLVGAFSIVEGIAESTGIVSLVRWPNDVTIACRKAAGVIAESRYRGTDLSYVVLGIGINCNLDPASLGALAGYSTSLSDQLGATVDLDAVRDATLESFEGLYSLWEGGSEGVIFAERAALFSTVGRRVEIELLDGGVKINCRAERVTEDGSLVVTRDDDDGSRLVVRGEEIRRLREI
jgi:BirA family transcriptional regulator, biotin operon repressor / biotin---[acetyl-CoA-carboxylase] ligase